MERINGLASFRFGLVAADLEKKKGRDDGKRGDDHPSVVVTIAVQLIWRGELPISRETEPGAATPGALTRHQRGELFLASATPEYDLPLADRDCLMWPSSGLVPARWLEPDISQVPEERHNHDESDEAEYDSTDR